MAPKRHFEISWHLLNGRKNQNFFKKAVEWSDSMKQNYWDLELFDAHQINILCKGTGAYGDKGMVPIKFWQISYTYLSQELRLHIPYRLVPTKFWKPPAPHPCQNTICITQLSAAMMIETLYAYSYLPNKRTCLFILFKKKNPPYHYNYFSTYVSVSFCMFVPYLFIWAYPFIRDLRVHPVNIHMRFFLFQI